MADVKMIPIEQIHVPPRLREVEDDHAKAIALSIQAHGLINPITVRYAPAKNKGETPYVLVAGAHRLRACELNGEPEIEAAVVEADQAEAQLIEITENLFRNDLSVMDRAVFVASYRDIWEEKHGRIGSGRPAKQKLDQLDPISVSPIEQITNGEIEGFNEHIAKRMGMSVPAIKRLTFISKHLDPAVRVAVRGTSAADNQSLLMACAKHGPAEQRAIVRTMTNQGVGLAQTLKAIKPAGKKPDPQETALKQLKAVWKSADDDTRKAFLAFIEDDSTLSEEAEGGE